jgi:hypothetical protein
LLDLRGRGRIRLLGWPDACLAPRRLQQEGQALARVDGVGSHEMLLAGEGTRLAQAGGGFDPGRRGAPLVALLFGEGLVLAPGF